MTFTNETNENEIINGVALIVRKRYEINKTKKVLEKDRGIAYHELMAYGEPWYLHGAGGTGKTYTIIELYKMLNDSIKVCATTNQAKGILKRAGVPTLTVHALFGIKVDEGITKYGNSLVYSTLPTRDSEYYERLTNKLGESKVIILDECSMLGKPETEFIIKACDTLHITIIFSGDHTQLPPVKSTPFSFKDLDNKLLLMKNHRSDIKLLPMIDSARAKAKEKKLWPIVLSDVPVMPLPEEEFMYNTDMAYISHENKPVIELSNRVLDYAATYCMDTRVTFFNLPRFVPILKTMKPYIRTIRPIYKEEVKLTNIRHRIKDKVKPYKLNILELLEMIIMGEADLKIKYKKFYDIDKNGYYWHGTMVYKDKKHYEYEFVYDSFNFEAKREQFFEDIESKDIVVFRYGNYYINIVPFYNDCLYMDIAEEITKPNGDWTIHDVDMYTSIAFWPVKWGRTGEGSAWDAHEKLTKYINYINSVTSDKRPKDKLKSVPPLVANYSYMLEYEDTYIYTYNSIEERLADPTSGYKEWKSLLGQTIDRVLNNFLGKEIADGLDTRDRYAVYKYIVITTISCMAHPGSANINLNPSSVSLINTTLYSNYDAKTRQYTMDYRATIQKAINKGVIKHAKEEHKKFWETFMLITNLLHSNIIAYKSLCYVRSSRVSTIHKMQGRSSKIVFINPKGLTSKLAYVAISRAEQEVYLLNQGATNE